MYNDLLQKQKSIAVIGLGYVGLPLALEFSRHFRVIGFDINRERIEWMKKGIDPSKELASEAFEGTDILFTSDSEELKKAHVFIIAVPTDIDEHKVPNLTPLKKASATVGKALKPGDYVIYESTVYPGCTEEDCLPILEEYSGLKCLPAKATQAVSLVQKEDVLIAEEPQLTFKLGYSPERISPGDKERTLTKILKIVSGSDAEALEEIAKLYSHIITAGVHKASSIKVAEAAKVIENTQRDLNISLMNELSIIFDRMGIDTNAVLEAAGTKWNFHKYSPGLVGGHCISVDPYYLLHKAKQLGHDPQVIAAGRRINDEMPYIIAKRLVQTLLEKGKNPGNCKVLVMGVTFKENVADIRNSKVVDLVRELMSFFINVHVVDPYASPNEVAHEYKFSLVDEISTNYDAVVVAVAHDEYRELPAAFFRSIMNDEPILMDLKGIYPQAVEEDMVYWRL